MKRRGCQVQVIEHPHLEVVEGKSKSQVFEYDLVHRESILGELRAYASIWRRPHDFEVPLKTFLFATILDDSIGLPLRMTKCRGYSLGLFINPIQSRIVDYVDQIGALLSYTGLLVVHMP